MKIVNWMVENWFLLVALAAVLGVSVLALYRFAGLPTKEQVAKIKEWLIWACIEAEKELQSGTGQLKLRQVYDMFCAVPAFSSVAKLISFETFEGWVTETLKTAKEMLAKNEKLAMYVYGDNADEEVKKLKEQLRESNSN